MSTRKKWRLKMIPAFTYASAPSMKAAYETVMAYQAAYAAGKTNIHHINVEVDEGLGRGWELFEIFTFDERNPS